MQNIKLTIEYDGTGFVGWQVQQNGPSIQGELEKAIAEIFKLDSALLGQMKDILFK